MSQVACLANSDDVGLSLALYWRYVRLAGLDCVPAATQQEVLQEATQKAAEWAHSAAGYAKSCLPAAARFQWTRFAVCLKPHDPVAALML